MKGIYERWLKRRGQAVGQHTPTSGSMALYENALASVTPKGAPSNNPADIGVVSTGDALPNIQLKAGNSYTLKCSENPKYCRTACVKANSFT